MVTPNWRHIFLAIFLVIVIWYVFFTNSTASRSLSPVVKLKKPEVNIDFKYAYVGFKAISLKKYVGKESPNWSLLWGVVSRFKTVYHWSTYANVEKVEKCSRRTLETLWQSFGENLFSLKKYYSTFHNLFFSIRKSTSSKLVSLSIVSMDHQSVQEICSMHVLSITSKIRIWSTNT